MGYQNGWWETFFAGRYVDFHHDAVRMKETASEVDFMLELLEPPPGARVLDLGCGEGRHAIEMAKRGYRLVGIDVTEPLLDAARSQAQRQQLAVQFEQRDMRDLRGLGSFNGAYCVWGSFGMFDDRGNQELVSAVYHALEPGGRLLIENQTLETMLLTFSRNSWHRIGNNVIRLEERRFDHTTSRFESTWIYIDEATGSIERDELSMRIYSYWELCHLLETTGFADCTGYDTTTRKPFALGSPRLSLVATKPLV